MNMKIYVVIKMLKYSKKATLVHFCVVFIVTVLFNYCLNEGSRDKLLMDS